ncbi:tRNA lysidine(34) synthetase TilS [Williamsia phyllosphaerae]|uniref:tRNA(Ile)-lysidine synthase n=1 Tax=Williamsia phyllosphaerae TaxID=885042 RepID=A0ABQ1ULK5_9NOCA|nr:tRNA lysidine(34) synthetase TilS [Williamsia phyllosphaerae]GGF21214.1 tRNA(Ile)-lysidine synthase [Williamsia phyllosphaerae]
MADPGRAGDRTAEIARAVGTFADLHLDGPEVCVGLSGGADSLALTAGAVHAGLSVTAIVVDHGLQHGSDEVARIAAAHAIAVGASAAVVRVDVGAGGGPEGAARRARYDALDSARRGRPVLLAHTLDDQAETVLLGLARGSGPRSIAGMVAWAEPWGRPLLDLRRSTTVAACAELGVSPYVDPHNSDPRFTRSRLRTEVLPLLEDILQGGVAAALARTATQLRADSDALDGLADQACAAAGRGAGLSVGALADTPPAIRRRVLRQWVIKNGATEPTEPLIRALDALAVTPGSRARVAIGGDDGHRSVVVRDGGHLAVVSDPRG